MKLFFLKEDSLYKIFKTLEKVPNKKKVMIVIDENNQFFHDIRRGKQIQQLIEQKNIQAVFVCKSAKTRDYIQSLWLSYQFEPAQRYQEFLEILYLFFFNAKQFHLQLFAKKNYAFYLIFAIELCVIGAIGYFLYTIILPKATVTIKPSYNLEEIVYNFRYTPQGQISTGRAERSFIIIPYNTGLIRYKYSMSITAKNVKYLQNPSQWKVKIINTEATSLSLLKGTKLITDNGLLFQTKQRVTIPAARPWAFGELIIDTEALQMDNNNAIMWDRGNIKQGTQLLIKNLKKSTLLKSVYGIAVEDFTWGTTDVKTLILPEDIQILKNKLTEHVKNNKKSIATKFFNLKEWFLLRFNDLIQVQVFAVTVKQQPGDSSQYVDGEINADIHYSYVLRDDLLKWVKTYLDQRPSENQELITIDKNSLVLYEKTTGDAMLIIPTKISTVRWYNFQKDTNNILDEIRGKIVWMSDDEAKSAVLSYPDIGDVQISVTPPRYGRLPLLQSRIFFHIQNTASSLE